MDMHRTLDTLMSSDQWNFNQYEVIFFHKNEFKDAVFKVVVILYQSWLVKRVKITQMGPYRQQKLSESSSELCPCHRAGTELPAVECFDVHCGYFEGDICTADYNPVCDLTGYEYGNPCMMAANICSWVCVKGNIDGLV